MSGNLTFNAIKQRTNILKLNCNTWKTINCWAEIVNDKFVWIKIIHFSFYCVCSEVQTVRGKN